MSEVTEPAPHAAPEPSRVAAIIDAWFVEHFHNSPVARATEAFNHARAALEHLKRRLVEEI